MAISSRHRDRSVGRDPVRFDRSEIRALLQLYSGRVVSGEWRDYALDHGTGGAVFSVFRHSFGVPLYSIEKRARGGFRLWSRGRRLAQGDSLADMVKALAARPRLVASR